MTAHGVDRSGAAGGSGTATTPIDENLIDAKGDLIVGTADNVADRLAVGANDTMLMADSAQVKGVKWATPTEIGTAVIGGQTALTSPASGDLLAVVDVSETPDVSRKITLGDTLKVVNDLTEDTAPDSSADYLATYDASASAAKKALISAVVNGAFRTMRVYTANDTWSKPAGLKRVKVTVVGGGGGSGACAATGAGQTTASGGGGGGGTSIKIIEAASLGSTESVTVGAAGTAGSSGAANSGGTGGTSSFGSHCQATGGTGGGGGSPIASPGDRVIGEGKNGGVGSGGDLNIKGHAGGHGFASNSTNVSSPGMGGASTLGGGTIADATGGTGNAVAGGAYGGGASGSALAASQSSVAGAAGAAGVVIVEEFF